MAFHIRNRETEKLARELARSAKIGLTEAVHLALAKALDKQRKAMPLWERSALLRRRVRARVKDKQPVGKEFYDHLYETKRTAVR